MQPIQNYNLESLQQEYKEAVIVLKPKKEMVSDKEVCIFLDYKNPLWSYVFWIIAIFSILVTGLIH